MNREDDRILREIEAGESWLREMCHEPPPPNADRIKLRVRIAAHEAWLGSKLADDVPAGLADRVKAWVRTSAIEQGGQPVPAAVPEPLWRRRRWWAIGVTGAAAAVLVVFIGLHQRATVGESSLLVDAFVSVGDDDFDMAIKTLDADVADVELDLDDLSLAQADDWMYLNIGDDLDSTASEPFVDDDWFGINGLDAPTGESGT